jgi:hypothetical protein
MKSGMWAGLGSITLLAALALATLLVAEASEANAPKHHHYSANAAIVGAPFSTTITALLSDDGLTGS